MRSPRTFRGVFCGSGAPSCLPLAFSAEERGGRDWSARSSCRIAGTVSRKRAGHQARAASAGQDPPGTVESVTATLLSKVRLRVEWTEVAARVASGRHSRKVTKTTRQPTLRRKMLASLRANVIRNVVPSSDNRRSHALSLSLDQVLPRPVMSRQVSSAI